MAANASNQANELSRGAKRGRAGNARGGQVQLRDPDRDHFAVWAATINSLAAAEDYLKHNVLDPRNITPQAIERDLWVQAQHGKFTPGVGVDMRLRYTFYRVLSKDSIPDTYSRIRAAALKLLPGLQQMADRECALKNFDGMRQDPDPLSPEGRVVDPADKTKFLQLSAYSNPAWDYANLRAIIAHCESDERIELLKAFCRARGYDERDYKYGDVALPPLLISAPPRKGKTALALAHIWFARRMGHAVQYGVAPNTNLVSQEVHSLLVRLGWWNNPAILGKCINGSDVVGVKARAFDEALQRTRYDLVLFSSDNNNHAKATSADIARRAVRLKATIAPADQRHGPEDDGLRGDVDQDARAQGATDVFVLVRDEAQTNARFGAEEEEDRLASATAALAREQAAQAVAAAAPDAAQLLPGIKRRIEALEALVEKREKAYERKLASSQEKLRPTFVTSKGFQVLVSATLLPTTQEPQLWGTLLEQDLPAELDLHQDRHPLPALGPVGHSQYVGAQCTDDAHYRHGYAPELVREWTLRLLKDRHSRKLVVWRTQFRDAEREVTRLETEVGLHADDPEYKRAVAKRARLAELVESVRVDLREANQRIPPYTDDLFSRPQFADKKLLTLDGGAIFSNKVDAHGIPIATRTTKSVINAVAQAARGMAWLDADIGERGGEVDRLIEAPEDSVAPGGERGAILPMTLVCPHNHTMRTKKSELRQHTQLDWVNRIAKLCCERKQPAFIAVFASSMDASKITRSIPEITFSDDAKRPNAFKDAKRQVTVFEIGPKAHAPAEFEIKPLAAPVADMDGVVSMLTARTNRFDAIGHFKLYAVGYDMFNGALTLSRNMRVEVFARDEDGVDRVQPQTRMVLAAPQRILFAHTNTRSIDSIYQIVGRTYNDLHFACPNFRIEILTGLSARGNLIAYAMAEDALIAGTLVPAGYPRQGEDEDEEDESADAPMLTDDLTDAVPADAGHGMAVDYEDGVAPSPAPAKVERKFMHECLRSAHTAFANAPILAKDEGMQTYELSQLVLGRKRRSMASTIGHYAPVTLEELRARGSHALALDDWEAPEEEEEEYDSDDDEDSDAEMLPERNDGVLAHSLQEFLAVYRKGFENLTNNGEPYAPGTIDDYCKALASTLVERSEFFTPHGHARPGMQGKRAYPDHLPMKDKDPKWAMGGEHYEVVHPGGRGKGRVSSGMNLLRRMFETELAGDRPCSDIFKSDRVAKAAAVQQMDQPPIMEEEEDM